MGKYEVLSSDALYKIFFIRLPYHLNLAFMANYYVMVDAFISMY